MRGPIYYYAVQMWLSRLSQQRETTIEDLAECCWDLGFVVSVVFRQLRIAEDE